MFVPINSVGFSLIRLCGNEVKIVEKSYVDKIDARKPLDFNLIRTSPEFLITNINFYHFFHKLLCNI